MEETLETTCFISMHRNQINPTLAPRSTLTFAHGDRMYGKYFNYSGTQKSIRFQIK
jgi:hypothetical protein